MTESGKIFDQVIALAGLAQSAALIDRLARTGYDSREDMAVLTYALFQKNPVSAESVFIHKKNLKTGLQTLRYLLRYTDPVEQSQYNYSEIMRYCLSILYLEKKLRQHKPMMESIGNRLDQIKLQADHFQPVDCTQPDHSGLVHENVLAAIASLYEDTLSTLKFRVQVNGNPLFLQQSAVVHKIRTLLLCGIRCAFLWRQVGGNRLSLLMNRNRLAHAIDTLLV